MEMLGYIAASGLSESELILKNQQDLTNKKQEPYTSKSEPVTFNQCRDHGHGMFMVCNGARVDHPPTSGKLIQV